jgi:hypothetical protein
LSQNLRCVFAAKKATNWIITLYHKNGKLDFNSNHDRNSLQSKHYSTNLESNHGYNHASHIVARQILTCELIKNSFNLDFNQDPSQVYDQANHRLKGIKFDHQVINETKVILCLRFQYAIGLRSKIFKTFKTFRHLQQSIYSGLLENGSIEKNPGPPQQDGQRFDTAITTHNVRGLNDEKKVRHLLNRCHKQIASKDKNVFICIQESYISTPGKIPYIWRGNYHLTPGDGNSKGCITLCSSHVNIVEAIDVGNRAHVIACQISGEDKISYIVANLYAPNPNNDEKISFFENVIDTAFELEHKYDCFNLVIAGDFNLVFKKEETKNRLFTNQEKRVSKIVKNMTKDANLTDLWEKNEGFTWRRPNTDVFSTIDRVLFRTTALELVNFNVNWGLSMSDHAAVETTFRKGPCRTRNKITRLDPSILTDQNLKKKFEADFTHQTRIC